MRLLANEIAGGVETVDANVHQRAAARHLSVEPPLAGSAVKAEGALDRLYLAELSAADHLDRLQVPWVVLTAVGDHQFFICSIAGVDHGLAVGNAGGHGLLTE